MKYSLGSNYLHIQIIMRYPPSKLGDIIRVETLTLNFSIKDGLKIVSKSKMKNCWSMIDQGLQCA